MKGAGFSGHLELPKPSRELIGVKSHDELQTLLLVRLVRSNYSSYVVEFVDKREAPTNIFLYSPVSLSTCYPTIFSVS